MISKVYCCHHYHQLKQLPNVQKLSDFGFSSDYGIISLLGGGGKTGKAAAKQPKMIGFWIFKFLWNCLIETLHLRGGTGVKTAKTAAKLAKMIRF